MKVRTLAPSLLTVALVLGSATACGKAVDKIAEEATKQGVERAIESETGAKVDLDDGSVVIESEDGKMTYGTASELPDDWPAFLKLPKGYEVASVIEQTSDGARTRGVQATGSGDAAAITDDFESSLKSAGFDITQSSKSSGDGGAYNIIVAEKGEERVQVSVISDGGDSETIISVNYATPDS